MAMLGSGDHYALEVSGESMVDAGIQDGDRILVEPWSYLLGPVERGDVIVLRYPMDPSIDYIKRVIGLPGDQVTLARGDRVAQLVIAPVARIEWEEAESLGESERGAGGFGSSGVR